MEFILYNLLGSQQPSSRPPPPPPPSSLPVHPPVNSNNNGHSPSVTLNPDLVAKFNTMANQNDPSPATSSTPPRPPPPPRNAPVNNSVDTVRRPPPPPTVSDFTENTSSERRSDQRNSAALEYDLDFERRFRFTPIDHLPPPEPWKPQPPQTKSSKNIPVN